MESLVNALDALRKLQLSDGITDDEYVKLDEMQFAIIDMMDARGINMGDEPL